LGTGDEQRGAQRHGSERSQTQHGGASRNAALGHDEDSWRLSDGDPRAEPRRPIMGNVAISTGCAVTPAARSKRGEARPRSEQPPEGPATSQRCTMGRVLRNARIAALALACGSACGSDERSDGPTREPVDALIAAAANDYQVRAGLVEREHTLVVGTRNLPRELDPLGALDPWGQRLVEDRKSVV